MEHMLIIIQSTGKIAYVNASTGEVNILGTATSYFVREKEDLKEMFDNPNIEAGYNYTLPSTSTVVTLLWKSSSISNYDTIIDNAKMQSLKQL